MSSRLVSLVRTSRASKPQLQAHVSNGERILLSIPSRGRGGPQFGAIGASSRGANASQPESPPHDVHRRYHEQRERHQSHGHLRMHVRRTRLVHADHADGPERLFEFTFPRREPSSGRGGPSHADREGQARNPKGGRGSARECRAAACSDPFALFRRSTALAWIGSGAGNSRRCTTCRASRRTEDCPQRWAS